ncbi:hypothetical protein T12_1261 [Trichinella patagoniensis]|uniref:Uncharacterized protein n=1 Tax=Trichinella patagoniensis TaxID=990121 RepID=A0A0V0YYX5_9BILA|nr:hypothetical protein T12_1261 [Trichinella patagoniensis]
MKCDKYKIAIPAISETFHVGHAETYGPRMLAKEQRQGFDINWAQYHTEDERTPELVDIREHDPNL